MPLGKEITAIEEGKGPSGSSIITSPFTCSKGSKYYGFGFGFLKFHDLSLKNIIQLSNSFSLGVSDNIDFSVSFPFIFAKDENTTEKGIGDLYLSSKIQFENFSLPIGLVCGLNLPTGSKKIVGDDNGLDFSFDLPIQIDFYVSSLNLVSGFTLLNINKDSKDEEFHFGIAYSRPLSEKIGFSAETMLTQANSNIDLLFYLTLKHTISSQSSFNFMLGRQIDENIISLLLASSFSIRL